jgi:molybdopterin-guanine dinucleotide biosynthesis protein A
MAETAVLLLAGGQARRFPGKLEHRIDGQPMLARCYHHVRQAGWPVYLAVAGSFSSELDRQIDAPMLVDRRPGRGPLNAVIDGCAAIRAERIFAIAADQPELRAPLLQRLAAAWEDGDEAVVPEHDGILEPLAALYDRRAVLSAALELHGGRGAMHDLLARLRVRRVACDAGQFKNVNRREDLPGSASVS